jgi:hypothetical protein
MGNARQFLKEMEKREKEREKERAKKAEADKKMKETRREKCKVIVAKRCECCEKNFNAVAKIVKNRKYTNKYCDECGKAENAKMRKIVKSMGSWNAYQDVFGKMVKYNDPQIKYMDTPELNMQRAYRKALGRSTTDIDRVLKRAKN